MQVNSHLIFCGNPTLYSLLLHCDELVTPTLGKCFHTIREYMHTYTLHSNNSNVGAVISV